MNANKNEKYKRNCLKKLMWWEKEEDGYKIKFVEFFFLLYLMQFFWAELWCLVNFAEMSEMMNKNVYANKVQNIAE